MEVDFCNPSPMEDAQSTSWGEGRDHDKGHWIVFFQISPLFRLTDGETEAQVGGGAVPKVTQVILS